MKNILALELNVEYSVKFCYVFCIIQTSGLYEYKIYGILDDVLPDICSQVYMDLDYRKQWDSYVKGIIGYYIFTLAYTQ